MKVRRLAKLKVTRVDLVEKGANPEAHVVLLKNEAGAAEPDPVEKGQALTCPACNKRVSLGYGDGGTELPNFCGECGAALKLTATGTTDEKDAKDEPVTKAAPAAPVAGEDPLVQLNAMAADIQKADPKLDEQTALAKAIEQRPELYREHRDRQRAEFAKVERTDSSRTGDAPTIVQLRKAAADEHIANAQAEEFFKHKFLEPAYMLAAVRAGSMPGHEGVLKILEQKPAEAREYVTRLRQAGTRHAATYAEAFIGSEPDVLVKALQEADGLSETDATRAALDLLPAWGSLVGAAVQLAKSGADVSEIEEGHEARVRAVKALTDEARQLQELHVEAGRPLRLVDACKAVLRDKPGLRMFAMSGDPDHARGGVSIARARTDPAYYARYANSVRAGVPFDAA